MRKFTLLAVLLAGGLLSCNSRSNLEQDFGQEVELLERKTTPSEAQMIARSGPVRSNWSVTASWEIQTTLGKAEYSKWVISQLQPEFKVVRADEAQLTLSKHEDNDAHVVECQFAPTKEKLQLMPSKYPFSR
jgi:hypothetical protein